MDCHLALVIHGSPKAVRLALDFHQNLVQMPWPVRICTHPADPDSQDLCGKHRAERVPPEPNRFMADIDTALVQQVLNVAERNRTHIMTARRMISGLL